MKIKSLIRTGSVAIAVACLIPVAQVQAEHHGGAVMAAIKSAERPATDKERDSLRKPADVLKLAGVAPGMTVLDINAAGGYYSELLSRVVGAEGKVYAHNGPVYWAFMKNTVPARYADGRLGNVEHIHNGMETFNLPGNSVDAALSVLAYHDYYFTHEARPGGGYEDVSKVLDSLFQVIKPGGHVVIVDHVGPEGSGPEDFDKLHRIDPTVVREQMEAAGFTFAGEADALSNPEDDHAGSPFAPEIRGKTDRFVYLFRK